MKKRANRKKVAVFSIFSILVLYPQVLLFSLPQGQSVEQGSATFENSDSSTLNIYADDKTVINFSSFNISQNETVNFIQPNSSASVLSRVGGYEASSIAGLLSANGSLFLVNPNGIHITPSAQINVGALIASTLDISTNNFINNNYVFEQGNNSLYAQILNEGSITAGNVVLLGSAVENTGLITATAGTVNLASGNKATLSLDAKGLIQVAINEEIQEKVIGIDGKTLTDAVANSGAINAAQVVMSAQTAANIFENAVNQTGIVKATGMVEENGVIRIVSNKNIQASGSLQAQGGKVDIASSESIVVNSELKLIGNTEVKADKDIAVNADINNQEGDIVLFADADLDGIGEFSQSSGTIETQGAGNILIDASGTMILNGKIATEDGFIKIGERQAPEAIAGQPHYIHKNGDFNITGVYDQNNTRVLETDRGDHLRYNTKGSLTLAAPLGNITDTTGSFIEADSLDLSAQNILLKTNTLNLLIYSTGGNININNMSEQGDLIILEADNLNVTYLTSTDLTLKADNSITAKEGLIITGPRVKLISNRFGSSAAPLNINSPNIYIKRLNGNIEIMESLGIGTSILLRGPPDNDFGLTYRSTTSLTLEAHAGSITSSEGVILSAGTISLLAYESIGSSSQRFNFTAAHLSTITSETGSIYFDSQNTDVYIRGDITAQSDIEIYSEEGDIDLHDAGIYSQTGSINLETTTGLIYTYGTVSAPYGAVRLWTSIYKDLRGINLISSSGTWVGNPENATAVAWDGSESGAWATGDNWSGGTAPTNNTFDVTINDATTNADVTTATNYTIGSLTMGASATVSLTLGGTLTIDDADHGTGPLTIGANGTLYNGGFLVNIDGNVTITGALTMTGESTTTVSGNWDATGGTITAALISQVSFSASSGTQQFTPGGSTYGTVNVTNSGAGVQLMGDLIIGRDLILQGSGGFDLGAWTVTVARDIDLSVGTLDASDSACNLDVGRDVWVYGTGTFSAPAASDASFTVNDGWYVDGDGTFVPNGGNVTFNATTASEAIQTSSTAADDFYDITFNGAGSWLLSDAVTATNNMTVTQGTLKTGGNAINVDGALTIDGGVITGSSNNVVITANSISHTSGSITTATSGNITIDSTGGTPGAFIFDVITSAGNISIGETTSPSSITLNDTVSTTANGTITLDSGTGTLNTNDQSVAAGAGAITFIADTIDLGTTADKISTTGAIVLKPDTTSQTIGIGDSATGTFDLDANEIAALTGYATLTIGADGNTGAVDIEAITIEGDFTVYGGNFTVDGNIDTSADNGAVAIDTGTGSYTQATDIDIDAGSGAITITTDAITINSNAGNNALTTSGMLTLKTASAGTAMSLALASPNPFDISADEIGWILDGATGPIAIGDGNSTAELEIGNAISFAGKTLNLTGGWFHSGGEPGHIITADTLNLIANTVSPGTAFAIGTDNQYVEIDVTNITVNTTDQRSYISSAGGYTIGPGTSSTGNERMFWTAAGIVTQSGALTTTDRIVFENSGGSTTLDHASNAISFLGVIDCSGQTFTLVNTAAFSNGGATTLTADTFIYTNTTSSTTLTNNNAINTLGEINCAGQSFSLTNVYSLNQTGAITADTFVLTLSATKSADFSSQANAITNLGAITAPAGFLLDNGNTALTLTGTLDTLGSNGAITLDTGTAGLDTADQAVSAGAGAITFIADTIDLGTTANKITTTGTVTLKPSTANRAINVSTTSGSTAFDLSTSEIEAVNNTCSKLTIGNISGSSGGTVTLNEDAYDFASLEILGNAITVAGALTTSNNTALDLDGGSITLTGSTNMGTGTVTLESDGAINGAGLVIAATVDIDASTGIGNTTPLELAATAITVDNATSGNVDVDNAHASNATVTTLTTAGGGTITFDNSGGGNVIFTTVTTTTDGSAQDGEDDIVLTSTGTMTINTITAGGVGDISLASEGASTLAAVTLGSALTLSKTTTSAVYSVNNAIVTVPGVLTIGTGATLAIGANTLNVTGNAVNSGAITISTGTLDIDGNFTVGTLTATDAANIYIAGNWSGVTSFTPNASTVTFDGSGTSIFSGDTTFYNLASSTAGKILSLTCGTTHAITHDLTLTGTAANPIVINDTGAGALPKFNLQAGSTQNISNVTVSNNDASGGLQLVASGTSILTNALNWMLGSSGAITFTWTGTVSTDWNNPSNWDLGLVPSSTDIIIIPNNTPYQSVLGGAQTLTTLTVNQGGTLSTGSQPLTITGNATLNGILNAGTSTVTVTGNLVTDSGGTIQGTSPTFSVSGIIGTKDNPLNTSVSGTLTLSAGNMQDSVSISIAGSGDYRYAGDIPGLVFVNGNIVSDAGQQSIRSSLIQGESGLYGRFIPRLPTMPLAAMPIPMFMGQVLVPMVAPMPLATPAIGIAPLTPAMPQTIIPAPLPKPSFEGITSTSLLPEAVTQRDFTGIISSVGLPAPLAKEAFVGAISQAVLPPRPSFEGVISGAIFSAPLPKPSFEGATSQTALPVKPSFEGIASTSLLPEAVTQRDFTSIISSAGLPVPLTKEAFTGAISQTTLPVRPSFEGIISGAVFPELLPKPSFEGATSQTALPVKPSFEGITSTSLLPEAVTQNTFEAIMGGGSIKLMFPGGQKIIPVYGVGVPLGAEKPVMEPGIQPEEKRR